MWISNIDDARTLANQIGFSSISPQEFEYRNQEIRDQFAEAGQPMTFRSQSYLDTYAKQYTEGQATR